MANNKTTKTDIYKIDPRNIVVTKNFNSRCNFGDLDELARQIKEQGVLNPISVQPFKDENGEEPFDTTIKAGNIAEELVRLVYIA